MKKSPTNPWLPIETAPQNGSAILALLDNGDDEYVATIRWGYCPYRDIRYWCHAESWQPIFNPVQVKYWQPLPSLPEYKVKYGLKECPFCASQNIIIEYTKISSGSPVNITFYAECHECGSRGARAFSMKDAVKAWNRRK